jgi:predicted RNase H-like HicB family nuclease
MLNLRIPLRVVFYKEGGSWLAHCLEFDLIGDGTSKEEALGSLREAIVLQLEATVEHDNPKNLFTPADGQYFAMFAAGKDVVVGEIHIVSDRLIVEQMVAREYDSSEADGLVCA